MLHIILLILKIIGIILLCILGIIILAVLAILFVPIRYRMDFSIYDKSSARIKTTWLLHIISASVSYENGLSKKIKIFGLDISLLKKLKKKSSKKRKAKKEKKSNETVRSNKAKKSNEHSNELVIQENVLNNNLTSFSNNDRVLDDFSSNNSDFTDDINIEKNKKSIFEKFSEKILNIKQKIKKLLYKIKSLYGRIKEILIKLRNIKEFLGEESTKEAFKFVKNELGILWDYVKPRKIKGHLDYSTGDPAYTAELLGIVYILIKGTKKGFSINPDFDCENFYLKGEMHIKGRIYLFQIILVGIAFYRNKNLREKISIAKGLIGSTDV